MGETEQEATLRRLSAAVATWEIGIFEHDYGTGETWASPRFREMLGFEPDEYVSMQVVARLCFPADVPMIQAAMQRVNDPSGDGVFDLTYRVVTKTGEVRWVRGRGITQFALVNGSKVPVRALGTISDVTEQHELKLAAERHERRLTQATTISHVGVFDLDHDPARPLDRVYWSPTFRNMTGYDPEAVPDIDWYVHRVHPADVDRFRTALSRAFDPALQAPFDVEYRWLHPDGDTRWCVARSTTTFHQKGPVLEPQRTVGAVFDITSARRAEEQLSQRSAILDRTPDIVCIADPDLRLVFLNQAGRGFANLGPESALTDLVLADAVGHGFQERFEREGRHITLAQGSWQVEMELEDHLQKSHAVSALVLGHWDGLGQLSHFSLVVRDLSHERQLEEQVRRSQKMEVIGRLAGGVAHDFNNILSVILGFSDVLEDRLTPDSLGHRDIHEIRFAAQRAAALTRQLLAISRNDLVRPRPMDLNDVIRSAEPMLRRLIDARVDITVHLGTATARIKADPSQIEQVLLNLVVNARDAMPRGGQLAIEVTLVQHRAETALPGLQLMPGPYVVLAVTDSGQGMTDEVRRRAFEPFFTTKEHGKGTGLGLATVQDIVEKYGGGVWLHSELGKGSTFKVYLPSTEEPADADEEHSSSPIQHPGGTILLVEDEAQVRVMLCTILQRAGYRVLPASGPVEALGMAKGSKERIDLLLTDVVMPQMTGPALAAELAPACPHLIVVYMSGYTEDAMVRQGLLAENINFIPKPFTASSVLRVLAQLLTRPSSSS